MIATSQDRNMHEIVLRAILRTGNRQGTQHMDLDMHAILQYCNTTGIRLRAILRAGKSDGPEYNYRKMPGRSQYSWDGITAYIVCIARCPQGREIARCMG